MSPACAARLRPAARASTIRVFLDAAGTIEQQIAHLLLYLISSLSDPDAEPDEVKELQARLDQVHAGPWQVAGQAIWRMKTTCGHAHAFFHCAASSHTWVWMHVTVANSWCRAAAIRS
jgi:hypothetical protein